MGARASDYYDSLSCATWHCLSHNLLQTNQLRSFACAALLAVCGARVCVYVLLCVSCVRLVP